MLGVGNLLWADEGFGVRCVEALEAAWEFPAQRRDRRRRHAGPGPGSVLQQAERVILFDAVDYGGEPGSLIVARDAEVPRFMTKGKMSLHQAGMNDVLACLEMLGHVPAAFTLIGLQPVELEDYGGSLTEPVRRQVPRALRAGRWRNCAPGASSPARARRRPPNRSPAASPSTATSRDGRPANRPAASATNDSLPCGPAPWTMSAPSPTRPRNTPHE